MNLFPLILVLVILLLGLAILAAFLWEWISIVRERRAVERCLRLHGANAKKGIDDLS